MNLRSKIIVFMIVMVGIATGANGVFNTLLFAKVYTKLLEEQSLNIGRSLEPQLINFLNPHIPIKNLSGFERQCKALVSNLKNISYAMAADPKGKIIFHSDPTRKGKFSELATAPFDSKVSVSTIHVKDNSNNTVVETHIPVFDSYRKFLGSIIVGFPQNIVTKERNRLFKSFSINNAFFTIAAALILFLTITRYINQFKLTIAAKTDAEKALRECEKRGKAMINALQCGIIITKSEDHTVVDANPAALRLLGRKIEDIKGKDRSDFFHPPFSPPYNSLTQHHTSDISKNVLPYRGVLKVKGGTEIPISITATPVIFNSKPHTVECFTDLRDLKIIEKERDKLKRQLRQAQKLECIGSLAGGIAHGFNNILASIIGYTEIVMRDIEKDSTAEKNLQKVFIAAIRAKDLVRQILVFARRSDDKLQPVRVDTIAKEALKLIRSTIPVTIKIKHSIKSTSWIMGNPTQLNQIFMNLCTNAAQAMEDKGGILEVDINDIQIEANSTPTNPKIKAGNYIQIVVADNGPGISEKNLGLIFKPYFTTKKAGEGTGMGLAMVQGIVERCGGRITAESKPDQGARFSILLPITQKREYTPLLKPQELPMGTERILFVDDEVLITEMGNDILGRLGYHITTCSSSLKAMALFRSAPDAFDLIITDMTMPEMTGDILAEQILALRPDIPIILFTGYNRKISDEKALAKGIKAFAYKPIIQEDLAITVRRVLDKK